VDCYSASVNALLTGPDCVVCIACETPCGFNKMEDSRPAKLEKQLDCAYDDQKTTSSMINAVVGGVDPACKSRLISRTVYCTGWPKTCVGQTKLLVTLLLFK